MKGYKGMIRDRMPKNWVFILKHFGCLNKWINFVYDLNLRKINTHWNVKERGPKKSAKVHDIVKDRFIMSLPELWTLPEDERKFWGNINKWILWFNQNYLFIKDSYEKYAKQHMNYEEIVDRLKDIYVHDENMTKAIIKYIQNGEIA